MFTGIKAVIFDMDGTLIDSMGVWRQIDIDYLEERNIPFPDDLQKNIEGMCFHDTAKYIKNRFSISESTEEMEKIWNDMAEKKYASEVKLKPGALNFLKYLKANGYKTGIATSNSRNLTDIFLTSNDLYSYFDDVLTGCDTLKSKPDPEIYLTSANRLRVNPTECLVFEDIVPGILAGKNAGMTVCAVDDLYSRYSNDKKKELADYFIESYLDIQF